jgi:hypothetical protein
VSATPSGKEERLPSEGVASKSDALSEMKKRRLVPADQEEYTADDYTQLLRMREAQALGAFRLIREKLSTLKGYAVETRGADRLPDIWLTLEGYRRYLFLKSQTARGVFEQHGAEAKFVFRLKDTRGKPLFDQRGMLTQEGDAIYNRLLRGLSAWWKYPDGRVGGNTRPPPELLPKAPAAPAQSAAQTPVEDAEAAKKAQMLKGTGYVEITGPEEQYLLKAAKMTEGELERESSLQVVRGKHIVFYLMAPSDPLFALVSRYRSGEQGASPQGTPALK